MATPHRIVVLLVDPVVGFDAVIPPQLLGSAMRADGSRCYDVVVAGGTGAAVPTDAGYAMVPDTDASALARADTVVIPGTRTPGPRYDGVLEPVLADALATIRPGTRLVSICTGAFVLGAMGVLDDRRATTHWAYADDFRRLYPAVRLDEKLLFVDDGDVLTSAGLAAGIDLCLHIIRRDHGVAVANHVARRTVVPPWRAGGQAQFIERPVPDTDEATTADARAWAVNHLGDSIDVALLARHARMSLRTFNRRFREETGQPPGVWLTAQRIEHARELLETGDAPVDEVARRAGLGTGASLRQHLRAVVGVSPGEYRRTFRGN